METAKRILTKEKIDRQLASQYPLTPFMSIKDGCNSKKVIFDMHDSLDDKIDKVISMMNKLTAQDNNQKKQFKPKINQGRRRGQSRYNYDQGTYQNRYRSNSGDRRTSFRGGGQYRQNYRGGPHYVNNDWNDFRRDNFRECKITEVKILEVDIEGIIEMTTLEEVEVGLGKDYIQVILEGMTEIVVVGQGQDQEPVLIEIELDALCVGNMIILLKTVQICKQKRTITTNTTYV